MCRAGDCRGTMHDRRKSAYYSCKGILSRELDKASHIILPVVSDCSPQQVFVRGGMTELEERSPFVLFVTQRLAQACCLAPSGTAHTGTHSGHHSAPGLPHQLWLRAADAGRATETACTLNPKLISAKQEDTSCKQTFVCTPHLEVAHHHQL